MSLSQEGVGLSAQAAPSCPAPRPLASLDLLPPATGEAACRAPQPPSQEPQELELLKSCSLRHSFTVARNA